MDFVDDELQLWNNNFGTWRMEEVGENTTTWRMKENAFTSALGHVEPSKELELTHKVVNEYRSMLIANPNMMYLTHVSQSILLELDVMAWLFLAYITGERSVPSREEMLETNMRELLESMHYTNQRAAIDKSYSDAINQIPIEHLPSHDLKSVAYQDSVRDGFSYEVKVLARIMNEAKYPIRFGDENKLNTMGTELLRMMAVDDYSRVLLQECDEETHKWKTYRDSDPTHCRSFITGIGSIPLKGKWLDINDNGNPILEIIKTEVHVVLNN
jgi:hypothetical protein